MSLSFLTVAVVVVVVVVIEGVGFLLEAISTSGACSARESTDMIGPVVSINLFNSFILVENSSHAAASRSTKQWSIMDPFMASLLSAARTSSTVSHAILASIDLAPYCLVILIASSTNSLVSDDDDDDDDVVPSMVERSADVAFETDDDELAMNAERCAIFGPPTTNASVVVVIMAEAAMVAAAVVNAMIVFVETFMMIFVDMF
mmetsp:Transcript_2781/g.6071  ORF Transcript_2781/g.6071 Transcript_2781/m.6071 type:complete len:204 (+) Transcript_2781:268-879(+)